MINFLGLTLVHAAWQGGVIAAVVAMLLWQMRRAQPSMRYVVAVTGLAMTVVAPVVTTLVVDRSAFTPPSGWLARPMALISSPVDPLASDPALVGGILHAGGGSGAPVATASAPDVLPRVNLAAMLPWVVVLWLLGVALLSARMVAGLITLRRVSRDATAVVDARLSAVARSVAVRLGLESAVSVLESARVSVPMVVGWVKPVVLIPVALMTTLTPSQLEMLLAHELAHVRRYDTLVNLAQRVIETLLFFHPAAWWLSARVREERENCCDELAIRVCGGERHRYGAMLLALEEARGGRGLALATAATDGSLLRRIRRIVVGDSSRVELGGSWIAGIATMLGVLIVITGSETRALAGPVDSPAVISQQQQTKPPATKALAPTPITPRWKLPPVVSPTPANPRWGLSSAVAPVREPNFSGRWRLIADSSLDSNGKAVEGVLRANFDSLGFEQMTVTHTDRVVEITYDGKNRARMRFAIIDWSAAGRAAVRGPTAMRMDGLEIWIDSLSGGRRLHATVGTDNVQVSVGTPAPNVNFGTWTWWLDSNGDLLIRCEFEAKPDAPVQRYLQRFRKA